MKYFIVAGERSGDLHGSNLIDQICQQDPEANIRAWGGDLMRAAGATVSSHYSNINFMGFWEVFKNIPNLRIKLRQCLGEVLDFQPDVLVLIDFAGFNLRLARYAKKNGVKVCYYISPKIWAWNKGRIRHIKRNVDEMLVVFPFEKEFYSDLGFEVNYIGNPILDSINKAKTPSSLRKFTKDKTIAFLPGSRVQEVTRSISIIKQLVGVFEEYHFLVSAVDNLNPELYDSLREIPNVEVVIGNVYDILRSSKAAVITSGTATLEAALLDVPQVVVYKTSMLTYLLARQLTKVRFISLINLILGRWVVTELVQNEYNAENVASELEAILSDESKQKKISEGYSEIRKVLGNQSASENAARAIIRLGRS